MLGERWLHDIARIVTRRIKWWALWGLIGTMLLLLADGRFRTLGTGSLGLARWVELVQGEGGDSGQRLLDLKQAVPSSLEALLPAYQPRVMGIHAIYLSRQYQPAILRAMLDFLAEWMGQEPALQAPEVVLSELSGIAR